MLKDWFHDIDGYYEGYCLVSKNHCNGKECNFIDLDGKYLSEKWFKDAQRFFNGKAIIKFKNGECYFLDIDGNIINCTENELYNHVNNAVKRNDDRKKLRIKKILDKHTGI